ncbi:hypothetical protein [Haloarcula sp. JP-L23]|uniref:hypothetical protein n=1 Tax=Haloarcula sp. JP-L23 TaxID=2716717 RepID=UPI00140F2C7B|nr:hypothetical protein G9465_25195 [Haloarcula sp. JP-L23]
MTKDEIVTAIDQICEKRGQPVVRISDIAELESIDVGKQAISDHLDELEAMGRVNFLSYGQKGVWWVPEDEDSATEVEVGVIQWENIDASEIPHEVLADLPQFQDKTYWESMEENWGTVTGGSVIIMVIGILAAAIQQFIPVQTGQTLNNVAAVVIVGSLGVALLSLGVVFVANIGQKLGQWGVNAAFQQRIQDLKYRIVASIQDRLPDTDE